MATTPDPTSSPTISGNQTTVPVPGFAPSRRRRPETTPASPPLGDAEQLPPQLDEPDLPDPDESESDPPPSPRKTRGSSRVSFADDGAIREAVEVAFRATGAGLNSRLAPEDEPDLWLTDDQDQERFAPPVASLIARRVPEDMATPDLADAIRALIALALYVGKQADRWMALRRRRRLARQPDVAETDHAQLADQTVG